MLEIIKAKGALSKVFFKTKFSLEEIQRNHPNRQDLIESMTEAVEDLGDASNVLHRLDMKCIQLSGENHRMHLIMLQLQEENRMLKEQNKNLINNATL